MPEKGVHRVGKDEFVVPGDLSITDWMDAFGARVEATHTTTVAGLLAAMLKRLPKEGDEVRFAHVGMRVEAMRGRRVERVRLRLLGVPGSEGHEEGSMETGVGTSTGNGNGGVGE
jgi:CBS domain containing-hemolysin-like protein